MRIPLRVPAVALLTALIIALLATTAAARQQPATVRTLKPYGVDGIEAALNSSVSPHGHEVVVQFEWGRTKRYGHLTRIPEEVLYPYSQHQEFAESIEGLSPVTTYHYRAVVSYEGKKIYGNDVRFKTKPRQPRTPGEGRDSGDMRQTSRP